jgi:hypothetical protein
MCSCIISLDKLKFYNFEYSIPGTINTDFVKCSSRDFGTSLEIRFTFGSFGYSGC